MLEHPLVSRINRTGYPTKEIIIRDKYGDEILPGDSVVEYEGSVVLHDNLERFLVSLGFNFKLSD